MKNKGSRIRNGRMNASPWCQFSSAVCAVIPFQYVCHASRFETNSRTNWVHYEVNEGWMNEWVTPLRNEWRMNERMNEWMNEWHRYEAMTGTFWWRTVVAVCVIVVVNIIIVVVVVVVVGGGGGLRGADVVFKSLQVIRWICHLACKFARNSTTDSDPRAWKIKSRCEVPRRNLRKMREILLIELCFRLS